MEDVASAEEARGVMDGGVQDIVSTEDAVSTGSFIGAEEADVLPETIGGSLHGLATLTHNGRPPCRPRSAARLSGRLSRLRDPAPPGREDGAKSGAAACTVRNSHGENSSAEARTAGLRARVGVKSRRRSLDRRERLRSDGLWRLEIHCGSVHCRNWRSLSA